MNRNEYIESFAFGNILVNVGMDTNNRCYFLEWADNGRLKILNCGTYNFHYKNTAEYEFGDPERDCMYYRNNKEEKKCNSSHKFGYCNKCKYKDMEKHKFENLIRFGILDSNGQITENYKNILQIKE